MIKALGLKPLFMLILLTHDLLQEIALPYTRDLLVLGFRMHET